MAASNSMSLSSGNSRCSPSGTLSSARVKKVRTKHACDECRRSQKKCDGEATCQRCRSNSIQCVYTAHKTRNNSEEKAGSGSPPDIHIFSDAAMSSFHTWSASSPSPSTPDTPSTVSSPTSFVQDETFEYRTHPDLRLPAHGSAAMFASDSLQTRRTHSSPTFSTSPSNYSSGSHTARNSDFSSLPTNSREFVSTIQEAQMHPFPGSIEGSRGGFAPCLALPDNYGVGSPIRSSYAATSYEGAPRSSSSNLSGAIRGVPNAGHIQRRPEGQMYSQRDAQPFVPGPSSSQPSGYFNPQHHFSAIQNVTPLDAHPHNPYFGNQLEPQYNFASPQMPDSTMASQWGEHHVQRAHDRSRSDTTDVSTFSYNHLGWSQ